MPLFGRRRFVGLQDRVDDRYEQSELRPLRSLGSHIAGRRRIAAHFGNRIPAQSEKPRRLAPALPFDEDKPSNRCVNLHREHPRPSPFESDFKKVRPRKWPGFTPPRATASCRRSMAYYCSAAYSHRDLKQSHTAQTKRKAIAIMRRSCSDSLLTANQMEGVFGSDKCNATWQSGSWLGSK
jgi:hypothetical protein